MLSIIWCLLLSWSFFQFTIPSAGSSFLASGPVNFFFFFSPLHYQFQHYSPSITLCSTTAFFILPVHFTHSILLYIHISNASSNFCSSHPNVKSLHHIMLHSIQSTSLACSLVLIPSPQKMLLFLLKASFAIAILCFTSWQQFSLLLTLHPKYLKLSTFLMDSSLICTLVFFR